MNYYIQGDAARAEQIKAAFEKLGYDVSGFDMCNDNILFFTYKLQGGGKVISTTNANLYTANIIKTHPDYKELELPVEPKFKFKVGDWIVCWNRTYQIIDNKSTYIVREINSLETRYEHSTVDENGHLWTIKDAKDGDVLSYQGEVFITRIARGLSANVAIDYDCCYDGNSFILDSFYSLTMDELKEVYPATKQQRDLLFAKMKEAGYKWDADKKELKKIPKHYDISNFHAGMPVLVRILDEHKWCYLLFSHCYKHQGILHFHAGGAGWLQCIPFNEDTEHLLGTSDPCDEQYINW